MRASTFIMLSMIAVLVVACNVTPTPPPTPTATVTPSCDDGLWRHIYHPSRLTVIDQCRTISGTITAIRHEADGDDHIILRQDSDGTSLVTEAICEGTVTQQDAIAACQDFTPTLVIPPVGSHVEVTGTYVYDNDHEWYELHPISSIQEVQV